MGQELQIAETAVLGTWYVLVYNVVISNPLHDPLEPPVGHLPQGLVKHVKDATAIRHQANFISIKYSIMTAYTSSV